MPSVRKLLPCKWSCEVSFPCSLIGSFSCLHIHHGKWIQFGPGLQEIESEDYFRPLQCCLNAAVTPANPRADHPTRPGNVARLSHIVQPSHWRRSQVIRRPQVLKFYDVWTLENKPWHRQFQNALMQRKNVNLFLRLRESRSCYSRVPHQDYISLF